jgi:hypothetical protein
LLADKGSVEVDPLSPVEADKPITSPGTTIALLLLVSLGTCFLESIQGEDKTSLACGMSLTVNTPFIVVSDAVVCTLLLPSFTSGTVGNPPNLFETAEVF